MQVSLDMSDAMELEQLLAFLAGWMKADHGVTDGEGIFILDDP